MTRAADIVGISTVGTMPQPRPELVFTEAERIRTPHGCRAGPRMARSCISKRLAVRISASAFVFRPYPDAAPRRAADNLRIDAGPGFGDAERRPLADELQRPGGRQRPGPPPGDEECGPPPPANGYRTGPVGSVSWSSLPPPWLPTALPPSENCKPNRKERLDAARSRGPPGRCSSGWSALGRIRAVRKISIPAEKADSPVTATATWSVRASSRVSIGTIPGSSASGGSHG